MKPYRNHSTMTEPASPLISAFIVCKNEAGNIRRCLESIKWCDEIVVIDSGSTDGTLEICAEYRARVFQRPWPGYVAQKRFGLEQCLGEWVLNIDADEEVSPELRDEIRSMIVSDRAAQLNGMELSRVVFYLNRWWRKGGWYPEFRLRVCRRTATTWGGADPHERAIVEGTTTRLKGELRHFTYDNISDHVDRLNKHSSAAADTMFREGKRSSHMQLLLNPLSRFLKFYFLKKGFLEGFPGLLVACLESYYVFLKYLKLWEIQRSAKER